MLKIKYLMLLFFCHSFSSYTYQINHFCDFFLICKSVIEQFLEDNKINIVFTAKEEEDIRKNEKLIKNLIGSPMAYTLELSEARNTGLLEKRIEKNAREGANPFDLLASLFQRKKSLIRIRKEYDIYKKNNGNAQLMQSSDVKAIQDLLDKFDNLIICGAECKYLERCFELYLLEKNGSSNQEKDSTKDSYSDKKYSYQNKKDWSSNNNYKKNEKDAKTGFGSNYDYKNYFDNDIYKDDCDVCFLKKDIEYKFGISSGPVSINTNEFLTKDDFGLYVYNKNDNSKLYRVNLKSVKFLLENYFIVGHYTKDLNDFFILGDAKLGVKAFSCNKIGYLKSNSDLGFYVSTETEGGKYLVGYFLETVSKLCYLSFISFNDWSELKKYKNSFNFEEKYLDLINKSAKEKNDAYYKYMFFDEQKKTSDSNNGKILNIFLVIGVSVFIVFFVNFYFPDTPESEPVFSYI